MFFIDNDEVGVAYYFGTLVAERCNLYGNAEFGYTHPPCYRGARGASFCRGWFFRTDWIKRAEEFFENAYKLYQAFKTGDPAHKRRLVRAIGWNPVLKGKVLSWEYQLPYRFLILSDTSVGTQENVATQKKNTSFIDEVSFWRAGRDLNPRPIA